ncbi:MAG: flagellar motor protein MotB [Desulfobacterales bacterium]|jgi:chemotaxis protein MotB
MSLLDDIQNPILEEGAPAWVVTFGDLMSLLLCFFVLLLSFSEMDKAKYKEVSGSLAKAFGVQRKIKAFQAPKGIKMISRDFDQELIPARPREEFIAMQQREKIGIALKKEVETRFRDLQDLIQVEVGEKEVTIRLMGETTFDSGKADIKAQMVPLLLKIGSVLADGKGEVIIAGHTDNVPVYGGPYGSNLKLSIARAATVAEFLLAKSAIPASRVSTMGFGKYRPIESNDTDEGRKRNRRVEIILRAPDSPKPQRTDISDPIRGNAPIVKNPVFQ